MADQKKPAKRARDESADLDPDLSARLVEANAAIDRGETTTITRREKTRTHEGPETEFVTRVRETEGSETADKPWDELTQKQKQARADLYRSLEDGAESTPPPDPDTQGPDETGPERPTRKPWAVYSGEKVDTVHVSKIIFQNPKARNSLSVMQMQRALNEAGYHETLRDRGGYFSDGTLEALEAFKADKNLTDADLFEVLSTLFSGDPNVALTR